MLDGSFARGTTPTHQFRLPFEIDRVECLSITYGYRKNNEVVIKKTLEDCTVIDEYVILTLSQEDTLAFKNNSIIQVQMKVLSNSGTVVASSPYYLKVESVLDEEIFE